jgi:hypothetical protein
MISWRIAGSWLVLLGFLAEPAAAQGAGMILWDQHIATAMNEALLSDRVCRQSPYDVNRPVCGSRDFSLTIDRQAYHHMHVVDRLAIFVDRIKDIDLDTEIEPGTEFKLKAKMSNIYKQEAEIRVRLDIEF